MPGRFFDTNILIYLASADSDRADQAEALLAGGGVVSVQVLNEIANVCRRKMRLSWPETHMFLTTIRDLVNVVPVTIETHETGLELSERYGLSTYDAMILAAAVLEGCETVLSEDMQRGFRIGSLRIENPFEAT
ncbi:MULTISPECIES: PIN domain-containing protein [unclassified Sinorhizobium]|uniref:PIN domain-containing protein n=1 Tax=unclassified Sinorhizobium TaxID=2613772 RepID=UPI003525B50A